MAFRRFSSSCNGFAIVSPKKIGIVEYWNDGIMGKSSTFQFVENQYSILPVFQFFSS